MLALLYLISSLIGLSVSVCAMRSSSLRRQFFVIAVAAILALAYSALLLVAELAQTGDVVISFDSLRSLKLPREVLKVTCIIIFTIGFMRLVYVLRGRESSKERI
jgi:hypothetical protein